MKKILKAIKILIRSQFTFRKPIKKKIVIFDKKSEIYISDLFEKNEFEILDTSYKIINVFIILKLILNFKKINYINYFSEIIKAMSPSYIFTFIDNNLGFYKLKEKFKDINFIAIQNGTRFITGDILEILEKNEKKYSIDYYFAFNDSYSNILKKYINGNYKTIGSYKNNFFNVSKNYNKGTICFISRMSDIFLEYSKTKKIEKFKKKYSFWEIELLKFVRELLKNINYYCEKNNLVINILGSSPKPNLEKFFFQDIFNQNDFNFIPKKRKYDSYKKIDQFEICINPMSTFGYEAISRGKKVCFFSGDFIKGSRFTWPLDFPEKGNFFSNSNTYEEVNRILSYLTKVDDKSWDIESLAFKNKLFFHDKNNSIIKKFLTEKNITKKWKKA